MKRTATAHWEGALKDGKGHLTTQSGVFKQQSYSFESRFGDESGKAGTNPEELLGAAHAGCFAMQLSHFLAENGTPATSLDATAEVTVEKEDGGFAVKSSALKLKADVPGIDESTFQQLATKAKEGCPLSKALKAITITLDAELNGEALKKAS